MMQREARPVGVAAAASRNRRRDHVARFPSRRGGVSLLVVIACTLERRLAA